MTGLATVSRMLLIAAVCGMAGQALAGVPIAKRDNTVDHVYGMAVPDPYRWMEGQDNVAFETWLQMQGAAGRNMLDASPAVAKWRQKLAGAGAETLTNRLQHRVGNRLFFLRLVAGKQAVLMVRMETGAEKVLLDPNGSAGTVPANITNYAVSPDGRTVAVDVDRGGQEITTVEFYSVDSGAKLPDELKDVWGELVVDWLDNTSVFYTQMAPDDGHTDRMYNMRVRFHTVGVKGYDRTVLAAGGTGGMTLEPAEAPFIVSDPSSQWAIAVASDGGTQSRICVIALTGLTGDDPRFSCPVGYSDGVEAASLMGSTLYLLSQKDAPNGQVLALDLDAVKPDLANARVVVPEDDETVIATFANARDGLYVRRTRLGLDNFIRLPYGGTPQYLSPPYDGQVALLDANTDQDGFVFTLQGWTAPRALFAYNPKTGSLSDLGLGATAPRDYSDLVDSERIEVRRPDGASVPVTILKPRGYRPDTHTLAIVMAYGAYGATVTQPGLDPSSLEWVAAGNLYVYAGVRGGGEKGDAWQESGHGEKKHLGVEDLVAVADALATKGYSDARHIALYSASAGGILVGNAIDRYPGHFGAAIIQSGLLNPTRLAQNANGPSQYVEFGDPGLKAGFASLKAMDAYLNIKPKVAYPAVLIDVGFKDSLVAPWNSGKFGAQLRFANGGRNPIVFRTDAGSTGLSAAAAQAADHYAFVEMTLGAAQGRAPLPAKAGPQAAFQSEVQSETMTPIADDDKPVARRKTTAGHARKRR